MGPWRESVRPLRPDDSWEPASYTVTANSASTVLSFIDQDTDLSDSEGG